MEAILESTSSANSKLNDFISHVDPTDQKTIKDILNGMYLYLKHQGFNYEEISKPQKSPYHGMLNKIGKTKDLDQLSWKLKVDVPLSYGSNNNPVYQFGTDIRDEVKSIARKVSGSYIMDYTNTDTYDAVGFNSTNMVCFGRHNDSAGIYYDHNNNIVKIVLVVKVVVARYVEDKSAVDTSSNHKFIMSKALSFVDPRDKSDVENSLDKLYSYVNKNYGGVIESKKVMQGELEIDTRDSRYDSDLSKILHFRTLTWKTELKSSSGYLLKEADVIKSFSNSKPITANMNGNHYTLGKAGYDTYIGVCHSYGNRGIEYLYFTVTKNDLNAQVSVVSNKFLSADGKSLKNKHVSVYYDKNNKSISGADLEDMFNMPRFMTTKKQGIEKAWSDLLMQFNEDTKDSDCMRIIGYDKVHSYCAMD